MLDGIEFGLNGEELGDEMKQTFSQRRIKNALLPALLVAAGVTNSLNAQAQSAVETFYSGKTFRLIVGYPAGTVFDTYSRMTLRHMVRHIPGKPVGIVQNMPGAGGLNAIVYVATVADPNGLSIALSSSQNATDMLLDPANAKFDPNKVAWIGSVSSETASCVFWGGKGRSLDDLKSRDHLVGTTGPTSGTDIAARALEGLFQYRFKYISGYRSTVDIRLAAERGEVDGMCGLATSTVLRDMPSLLETGAISAPIQMGLKANPGLPEAPNALDIASTTEEKQIIKLVFGPLGFFRMIMTAGSVPSERIAALRNAFDLTMKDSEFLSDMDKAKLDVLPLSGAELTSQINELYKTPTDVVERTLKILGTVR